MWIVSFSCFTLLCTLSCDACAYLDPGTGSYALQLIIAGVVSALFAVKMAWRRIVEFFTNLFRRK